MIDPDTNEPTDMLQPQAAIALEALGCTLTKPSEIAQQKVEVVIKKIHEGISKANQNAISDDQKVCYCFQPNKESCKLFLFVSG